MRRLATSLILGPAALLLALVAPASIAAAGPITSAACSPSVASAVTCNLWAETGTLTLPGTTTPIWGFAATNGGSAGVPGPVLIANSGDTVTVNLTNHLSATTAILFEGQPTTPDLTGVAAGGSKTYTFTAGAPGTYLYEAGLLPGTQYQVAKGLYGALIVRPAGGLTQANNNVNTAYTDEALVILGEVDGTITDISDLRGYAPHYFLINGKAHPQTDTISTTSGGRLLLRYLNAGLQHHSMGVLGLRQTVVNDDGSTLANPRHMVAESLSPGQGTDVLIDIPTTTALSTKYAIYDASMALNNTNTAGIGGMITLIDAVGAGSTGDTVGPLASNLAISAGTLSASVSDATTGAANMAAAEYFIDTLGAAGTGALMTGTFPSDPAAVSVAIGTQTSGDHTAYIRGQDGLGNWGAPASLAFSVDTAGPATTGVVLNPAATNGSTPVSLTATADDRPTGAANIAAAEFFIGAAGANGSGTAMALNTTAAPVSSLSATIPAGFAPGTYAVVVHSQDALGNWGPTTTVNLSVSLTGPVTSAVSANRNPTNGLIGVNSTNPSIRIQATFDVAAPANIKTAEVFIDTAGANGTGVPMAPSDGLFETIHELGYADIPLTTIAPLAAGNHTIIVRGKDSLGNWGSTATITLVIDRVAPTFTGITLQFAHVPFGFASVGMTVNGSNGTGTAVSGGEFWIANSDIPAGTGTAFSGTTANVPTSTLVPGFYTVRSRVRDAAGNWSTVVRTALLHVTTVGIAPAAIFSTGFELQTLPGTATSVSTRNTTRINVTASAALDGSLGLRAQGNAANYIQYSFGTADSPATAIYDARFSFRPNAKATRGQDIFAAATNSGFRAQVFRVRYRLLGRTPQVQIQIGTSSANRTWTTIKGGKAANKIEVIWQAARSGGPNAGTLRLFVNGKRVQTLRTSSTRVVGAVRLGAVTSGGGSRTAEYFDAFASKRSATPFGK